METTCYRHYVTYASGDFCPDCVTEAMRSMDPGTEVLFEQEGVIVERGVMTADEHDRYVTTLWEAFA